MKTKKIDFITLSPLLLITLLPVSSFLLPTFTRTAAHPEVAFLKYFSIPLIGFSLGCAVFLGIIRDNWKFSSEWLSLFERHSSRIILTISCIFFFLLSSLAVLRYITFHTTVFDMGTYDKKIWEISVAPLSAIPYEVARGHFQPILIIYGLIYKIFGSPVIIQLLQATFTISGIVPVYLISKRHLNRANTILAITLIYLFYPPIGFNATLDFHPDHIYIPLMIWAFFFAERNKYILAITLAGIGAMAKEPLIIGVAFFGLYLAIAKKQYKIGVITFLFFLSLFLIVVFKILPYVNQSPALSIGTFPFFENNNKVGIPNIKSLIDSLTIWRVRKMLFIYFLLAPLFFLPLLEWRRFLPAIPLIAIPILSTTYLHSSVDSQYTAGIVAPALVALVFSIKRIEDYGGVRYANAFAALVMVMTISFHIAHGSSPLSINFWKPGWGEIWHKSNYTSGEHEEVVKEAIYKISEDRDIIVVSQGNVNHSRLAHRYNFYSYPDKWEEADYILLDTNKPLMIVDHVDEEFYLKDLKSLRNHREFKLEFQKDGVFLFKRAEKGRRN
jgi:uncharacterized membrane protein